ncbi:MAG: glyoxalase/bleomycin resistance/extradiol dioxygenase family protein [Candidatus Magasanikbacteria bacterium CG11_big_fil_rev_8_21_14_0_20_39_34]|uniref:Glyoxalase/bleomycin resistance/extradiol dioxygenase family protein n=1 Tax=Candidatus Magasanikbacteria bacterium CG11_big_fil_rev_8_21_14_0_20_39_34 TaxID=1974653 RepID=A0A2H0N3V5_9BACT|nr:MAG: glyoxalase/bleomycin resistance/extradiol dioxygenase family protein [Candidatus Magasanikbacteria bacterium CG11_big_fil_rev_8_21_14_0_20_39_34]
MIDHITIKVSHLQKSINFYEKALAPLGYKRFEGNFDGAAGFGKEGTEDSSGHIWMFEEGNLKNLSMVHVAFTAEDENMVKAFYLAALSAGGKDNGSPGLRPEYGEKYFGAFVLDPDGNNIEATSNNFFG